MAGEDLGIASECRVAFSKSDIGQTFNELSNMNASYRRGMKHSETAFRPLQKSPLDSASNEAE